ncbi:HD domain-containing protein [Spirochaetota bacterium]
MITTEKYLTNTICIDFDGVLAKFSDNINEFGIPIDGGSRVTGELMKMGYKIIIHTARPNTTEHKEELKKYLLKNNIYFDEINTNPNPQWPSDKPLADIYIDDRALKFRGDWDDVLWQVMSRREMPVIEKYELLLGFIKERSKEVMDFDMFLRDETTWLTSPASTRFHLNCEGGLLEHSVNVAETLLKMRRELMPELSLESCIICALFHDLGKLGYPGIPYYIKNPDKWQVENRNRKYIINKECTHMDIATRSLYLVSQHITLTPGEAQAIRYHDGQYIEENHSVAHRETPLTRLLQYADNWSAGIIEEEK